MLAQYGKRLLEDYLPIQAISKEASRDKNVRKGHLSTLHLWWARRPLIAWQPVPGGWCRCTSPHNRISWNRARTIRGVWDLAWLSTLWTLGLFVGAGCVSRGEFNKLAAERDRLAAELDSLRSDWALLQDESDAARLVSRLRDEHKEKDAQLTQALAERDQAGKRAVAAERDKAMLEQKLQELQTAHGELKEEHDKLQQILFMRTRGIEYRGTGQTRTIRANIDRGEIIVLDDGSIWNVDPLSRLDANLWMRFDEIVVVPHSRGLSPYKLVNVSQSESAEAACVGYR